MTRVSVITPAFNADQFLEETVKSVISQTYKNWEMIIVDDCSVDNTYKIAKKMASEDSRIKVFQNKTNLGVALTRNVALDIAVGEYIAFLDADDIWLPEKLEKQIEFMDKEHHVLTYTNYRKFDSVTGEIHNKIIKAPAKMTERKIYGDTSIACLTVMVNRDLSGPFHMPNLCHGEDNITWQSILSKGFTAYRLDEVLSLYREGNDSLTSEKRNAAKKQWQNYRLYYKFSVLRSAYYFASYGLHAIIKHYF